MTTDRLLAEAVAARPPRPQFDRAAHSLAPLPCVPPNLESLSSAAAHRRSQEALPLFVPLSISLCRPSLLLIVLLASPLASHRSAVCERRGCCLRAPQGGGERHPRLRFKPMQHREHEMPDPSAASTSPMLAAFSHGTARMSPLRAPLRRCAALQLTPRLPRPPARASTTGPPLPTCASTRTATSSKPPTLLPPPRVPHRRHEPLRPLERRARPHV
jgi:hypothetical protein